MRNLEESEALLGGEYCLTSDNLLKMLAIFIRLKVGIPVVLMGECGYVFILLEILFNPPLHSHPNKKKIQKKIYSCGKTALLNYLCAWLEVDFLVLNVHGGTTQQDILNIFEKATKMVGGGEGEEGGEEEGRVFGGSKVVLGKRRGKKVYVFLDEVFLLCFIIYFLDFITYFSIPFLLILFIFYLG